ncbi:MAG: sigma-70 family RNA polymerase sigma factor [Planctomycetota bacterium]
MSGEAVAFSDREALKAFARRHDAAAFNALVDRYGSMVLATCRRALQNEADAEEAAQETFLKLARHADRIRSNTAAWLHAAAKNASTDLVRKRGAQRRAEEQAAKAAALGHDDDTTPEAAAWRDIEPMLELALDKLSRTDRDLIVAHYLSGRSQADLAAEAGVSRGTMSRRIGKALERLRFQLKTAGCPIATSAGAVALVAGAMIHAVSKAPSLRLTQNAIGKIALAGSATTVPAVLVLGGLAISKSTAWIAAGVVGAGAIAGGTLLASSLPTGAAAPTSSVAAVKPPDRPKRPVKNLVMVRTSAHADAPQGLTIAGNRVRVRANEGWWSGADYALDLDIQSSSGDERSGTLTMVLRSAEIIGDASDPRDQDVVDWWRRFLGKPVDATYTVDSVGRLTMQTGFVTPGGETHDWTGVRAAPDHPQYIAPDPNAGKASLDGRWLQISDWSLEIDREDVSVMSDGYKVHRFHILDWQEAPKLGGHARVQAIIADSMAPGLVGKRAKVLLRENDDGSIDLAFHERNWDAIDEWPASFEGNKDSGVMVRSFKKAKP